MKKFISVLLAAAMLAMCLPSPAEESAEETLTESLAKAVQPERKIVTRIITEPFCEGVTDEDSAEKAVLSVAEQLGADENTELMLEAVRSSEDLTYYVFRQTVGDILVGDASVKLIVNAEGTAVCAVSTLLSGLDPGLADGGKELTEEQAEAIVADTVKGDGLTVLKGMSHQAVVDVGDYRQLVWVVYTDNPYVDLDVAYMACYVSHDGEFLGGVPMVTPFSADEESARATSLVFLGMEPDIWSGDVTLFDGTVRSLTVPVMKDAEGTVYLGDLQRKILCVDFSAWEKENDLKIRVCQDGRFDDGELLIYESTIRVWDFYNSIGWEGADGIGTPILLKMDMVDENGEPIQNAYYSGKSHGYQTFCFNRLDRDGETIDVIGHEFTHCVTTTLSVNAPYQNDCGAINEALSDIMGNLLEEMLDASDDPDWLIGEAAKNPDQILRCMSDPHQFRQPAFVWDRYYKPSVSNPINMNDFGGVHGNSSLLNLIAWRLHEAGMAPEDEFYYMMNVILTMTGSVDYPGLAVLLPWCLEQVKMGGYAQVLEAAIEETGIRGAVPERYAEGCALVIADIPGDLTIFSDTLILAFLYDDENGETQQLVTWPDCRLNAVLMPVPAGRYVPVLEDKETGRSWILTADGWTEINGRDATSVDYLRCDYEPETLYELPTEGLAAAE